MDKFEDGVKQLINQQQDTGVKLTDNVNFFDSFTILAYTAKFKFVDTFSGGLETAYNEFKTYFYESEEPIVLEYTDDLAEFVKRLYDFRAMASLEEAYGDIVVYPDPINPTDIIDEVDQDEEVLNEVVLDDLLDGGVRRLQMDADINPANEINEPETIDGT